MKIEIKDKEHNHYYQQNPKMFDQLIELLNKYTFYTRHILKNIQLVNFIFSNTKFLDIQNPTFQSRMHCIINNIVEIPLCETCNKIYLDLHDCKVLKPTKRFCSSRCMNSSKEIQQKRNATMKTLYGVEHALQDKNVMEKVKAKSRKTCLARYGVACSLANEEVKDKARKTNIRKYGTIFASSNTQIKQKIKESVSEKYGKNDCQSTKDQKLNRQRKAEKFKKTCLERYGTEHHMRNKDIYQKSRNTCLERYGTAYPIQKEEVKEKLKKTNLEKYGVEWNITSKSSKEKFKNTSLQKYGVEWPMQNKDVYHNYQKSIMDKYGVEHNMQNPDTRRKQQFKYHAVIFEKYGILWPMQSSKVRKLSARKYKYEEVKFDSGAELAFYTWLKDNNIEFEYQPNVSLKYEFDGKEHSYIPDFKVKNQLIEIKGDHFLREDGVSWKCPWARELDDLYEAKRQCCIANGVKIMYEKDYMKYIDYVKNKYGKDYLKQFKA